MLIKSSSRIETQNYIYNREGSFISKEFYAIEVGFTVIGGYI